MNDPSLDVLNRGQAWINPIEVLVGLHAERTKEFERNATAEHIINAAGIDIDHFSFVAGYGVEIDRIRLPERRWFKSATGFYSTAFHELGHATGSKDRLNRTTLVNYKASLQHEAVEEMIAEFTAAFILICQN